MALLAVQLVHDRSWKPSPSSAHAITIDVGFVVVSSAALPGAVQFATTPGSDCAVALGDSDSVVVALDEVGADGATLGGLANVGPVVGVALWGVVAGAVVALFGWLAVGKFVPACGSARCEEKEQPVVLARASTVIHVDTVTLLNALFLIKPLP